MREILYYRTLAGQTPIDYLTAKETQKVLWVFSILEELETVPAQYLKIENKPWAT